MSETKALRRRVVQAFPYTLRVEDASGDAFESVFRIAYDLNAFTAFEEVTGINVMENLGVVFDKPSVPLTTALLWAGLQIYHPEYAGAEGLETIRANVTLSQIRAVRVACSEAFLLSLPKEQAAKIRQSVLDAAQAAVDGVKLPNVESPSSTPASV